MLEKYFPNLYGWLVWGGGFAKIKQISILLGYCLYAIGIFLVGFFIGGIYG